MLKTLIPSPGDLSGSFRAPELRSMAQVARTRLGVFEMPQIAVLRLSGADRIRWLHGQCTQDVKGLPVGEATMAYVLDPKGRNLADIVIGCFEEHLVVLCPAVALSTLLDHWKHFIIAEDVTITADAGGAYVLTGLEVPALLRDVAGLPEDAVTRPYAYELRTEANRSLTFLAETNLGLPASVVVGPVGSEDTWRVLASAIQSRGSRLLPQEVFHMLRIAAGKAQFGIDIDGTTLPKESGDEPRRVSYTKGCYTGQEVVARQHFLGEPRRVLRKASWRGGMVAVGSSLSRADGTRVGRLTSCALADDVGRCVGLAVIEGAAKVELDLVVTAHDIDDEPVTLVIAPPQIVNP